MRNVLVVLLLSLMVLFSFSCGGGESKENTSTTSSSSTKNTAEKETVELVFTSWRTEDLERMNRINAEFTKKNPNIKIKFEPILDSEYNEQLDATLRAGTGADILFLRSYDGGYRVYETGSLYELNDVIPGYDKFASSAVNAWSTEDGKTYAVPSVGVTHGIFYNKAIFDKHGLSEPETWAEFIALCTVLKEKGETVFAQGTLDEWTLYEVVFSGLGANFYGGEAARQALMKGEKKLTDPEFVKAFEAVNQLAAFFPDNKKLIDYPDMQQMFATGQAAMFIGGSWEISVFEDLGDVEVEWFAPPVVNKGDTLNYCFHVDAGIAVNKNSKNLEAALTYIKWVSSPEYATLIMNELPGFFSYTPGDYALKNSLAEEMIGAAKNAELTVRTVWEKLSAKDPSGNALMGEALPKMANGDLTPAEAAAYIQEQLETWYPAFQ